MIDTIIAVLSLTEIAEKKKQTKNETITLLCVHGTVIKKNRNITTTHQPQCSPQYDEYVKCVRPPANCIIKLWFMIFNTCSCILLRLNGNVTCFWHAYQVFVSARCCHTAASPSYELLACTHTRWYWWCIYIRFIAAPSYIYYMFNTREWYTVHTLSLYAVYIV